MIFIILSIISSTAIYVVFKYLDKLKVNAFNVIVINYIVASVIGLLLTDSHNNIFPLHKNAWLPYAVIIGVLFILMFVVIAKSSQVVGIAITSISNKMSVIIPIAFSIIIDPQDVLSELKLVGISLAIIAVFFTVYQKRTVHFDPRNIYLPIILFLGMGVVDSFVKYAQHNYVGNDVLPVFSVILFIMAAISGLIAKTLRKTSFRGLLNRKVLIWGIALGISNYGSLFFIINALNYKKNSGATLDGSIVFGINNLGVIALSVIIGLILFKEKFLRINWVGIIISFVAIYILSMI